jgi:hypothetical protein
LEIGGVAVTDAKGREGASNDSKLNKRIKAYSNAMTAIAGASQQRDFKLEILRMLQPRGQIYPRGPGLGKAWQA